MRSSLVALIILGGLAAINASTVDFKTAFSSLFKRKTVILVWISPQNQIWGMDTKDGVVHPFNERKRVMTKDAFLAGPLVNEIILYSLSDRKIARILPRAGITLEKVRKMAGPESYFIGVQP